MTRLRKLAENNADMDNYFKQLGFNRMDTGGGCTAWHYQLPNDQYFLVTEDDGLCLPEDESKAITLGLFNNQDDEFIGEKTCSNFENFKSVINNAINNPESVIK